MVFGRTMALFGSCSRPHVVQLNSLSTYQFNPCPSPQTTTLFITPYILFVFNV